MRVRSAIVWAGMIAATSIATPAAASPSYPTDIESDLMLSYQPPCSLCHENGVTGIGTVTTPFGVNMRARGLVAEDPASLSAALQKMDADMVDSDKDTVLDIDELVQGTDPNVRDKGSAPSLKGQSIAYGCGAEIAGGAPGDGATGLLTLVIALVIAPRRRASRCAGSPRR